MVARGCWEERMNWQSTEDFQGSKIILYESTKVDSCHYTFLKTHGMYNTKNKLWTFSDNNVST